MRSIRLLGEVGLDDPGVMEQGEKGKVEISA